MDFLAGICGPQVEAAPALGAPLGVWLHDATPAEDKKNACSPALVNAKCSLEHGALEETFNGAATAWEIMAKSFEQYGERNALGARALKKREMEPDEKSGKAFEKLTYADAYDWVTYAELEKQTAALAAGLVKVAGLKPGAKVLIFAETQRDWMVTALACWRQGATVVTAYATLGEEGVSSAGNQTGAAVCVCDGKLFKTLAKAAKLPMRDLKLVVPIMPADCEDTTGDQLTVDAMKEKLP